MPSWPYASSFPNSTSRIARRTASLSQLRLNSILSDSHSFLKEAGFLECLDLAFSMSLSKNVSKMY